jgi:serine/threonine protein kinase
LDESSYPLIGETLDRYRVVQAIGEGAMGCVYRAKHTVLPREYAIKVLFRDMATNVTLVERFRREAQSVSTIAHPNIVSVLDFVTTQNGVTFIVMELVEGRTLDQAISAEAPFTLARTALIARQIAAGLGEAHRMGFVHRDVKPSNIMLTGAPGADVVKILDFGVVGIAQAPLETRLTAVGHIIGTPTYMAPEQVSDPAVGPGADLYALGVIMFEMLAGEPPFQGPGRTEVFVKHISEPPPALPPSDGLELVVAWLLEKRPEQRPRSAEDVVRSIDGLGLAKRADAPAHDHGAAQEPITDNTMPRELVQRALNDTDPNAADVPDADVTQPHSGIRSSDEMFPTLMVAPTSAAAWGPSWNADGVFEPLTQDPQVMVHAREEPTPAEGGVLDEPELPRVSSKSRLYRADDGPTQVDYSDPGLAAAEAREVTFPNDRTVPTAIPSEGEPVAERTMLSPSPVVFPDPSDANELPEDRTIPPPPKQASADLTVYAPPPKRTEVSLAFDAMATQRTPSLNGVPFEAPPRASAQPEDPAPLTQMGTSRGERTSSGAGDTLIKNAPPKEVLLDRSSQDTAPPMRPVTEADIPVRGAGLFAIDIRIAIFAALLAFFVVLLVIALIS